jgi:hypothetical protein
MAGRDSWLRCRKRSDAESAAESAPLIHPGRGVCCWEAYALTKSVQVLTHAFKD